MNFGKNFHSRSERNQDPWGVSLYSIYPPDSCRPCLFWRLKSFNSIDFAEVWFLQWQNISPWLLIFSTSGKIFQPQLFRPQNISTCPSFFCYDEIIFQITNFWIKRLLIQPKLFQPSTWIGLLPNAYFIWGKHNVNFHLQTKYQTSSMMWKGADQAQIHL